MGDAEPACWRLPPRFKLVMKLVHFFVRMGLLLGTALTALVAHLGDAQVLWHQSWAISARAIHPLIDMRMYMCTCTPTQLCAVQRHHLVAENHLGWHFPVASIYMCMLCVKSTKNFLCYPFIFMLLPIMPLYLSIIVASSLGSLLPPEVNWAKAGGSLGSEITWTVLAVDGR